MGYITSAKDQLTDNDPDLNLAHSQIAEPVFVHWIALTSRYSTLLMDVSYGIELWYLLFDNIWEHQLSDAE